MRAFYYLFHTFNNWLLIQIHESKPLMRAAYAVYMHSKTIS